MLVDGLAGSINRNGKDAVKAATNMSASITDVMNGLAEDMQTSLPTEFSVKGSVNGVGSASNGLLGSSSVINIYPQTMDEAMVDYLFTRFNARLGVV